MDKDVRLIGYRSDKKKDQNIPPLNPLVKIEKVRLTDGTSEVRIRDLCFFCPSASERLVEGVNVFQFRDFI